MTIEERDEVISTLQWLHDSNFFFESVSTEEDVKYATKLAIEALEQEPCNDAISRQAVLDATVKRNSIWNMITNSKGENLEEIISQLPSVSPKQRTGRWIIIDDCEQFIAKCSECGRIEDSRMISKYLYCHCGAKMEVEKE